MTILKVQYNDEIRRVTIEDGCTLTELASKVRYMFPQLRNFVMSYLHSGEWIEIKSNEDLVSGVAIANLSVPPVFRININVSDEPVVTRVDLPQELEFVSPEPEKTESPIEETPAVNNTETNVVNAEVIPTPSISTPQCAYCTGSPTAYRCINCFGFSICETCEASNLHDPTHLLVKISKSVEELPLKQQLIFTQHIEGPTSDRTLAKNQSKELRRAIRDASLRRKEQRARKERSSQRRCWKSGKKPSSSSAAVVDVLPLVNCETAVVAVAPVVEETIQIQEVLVPVAPVDPTPQEAVEDFCVDSYLPGSLESATVNEVEPEVREVEIISNEVEEDVDDEEQEEEVVEQDEEVEGGWNLMGLLGWTRGNQDRTVNVNDYRIQGIAFQNKLDKLEAMGFTDRNRNMILLAKNLANLERTVEDLTC
eukprot:TRINITY_DN11097_c0_g1_i1.p1 TRINITY_DN11097_c0_g1~~TRINITY_DN11097_c0_g1_i1.p1  ORF type:complete len:424 (-),score=110.52 TRINITY_DN11097_c0_g1_i1:117-1388(-)